MDDLGDGEEEGDLHLAEMAYELLSRANLIPGTRPDGAIDRDRLFTWTEEAIRLCREQDRAIVGAQSIGEILAHCQEGTDGIWPAEEVRELLERVADIELEQGLEIKVFNLRGATSRSLGEGGDQERDLEGRYRGFAESLQTRWPRASAMLHRIADSYASHAKWEDRRDAEYE